MKVESQKIEIWNTGVKINTDSYGKEVYEYAERWADLMESKIEDGFKIQDIAKKCSHEANINGLTGFMYGCAVEILSDVWKYGEELRRWHNLDIQIGNEGEIANKTGGVLNPALLSIKTRG